MRTRLIAVPLLCALFFGCSDGEIPPTGVPRIGLDGLEKRGAGLAAARLDGAAERVVDLREPTQLRWTLPRARLRSWTLDLDGRRLASGRARSGAEVSHRVDTSVPGTHQLRLGAVDVYGGMSSSGVTVHVRDRVAPEVSASGDRVATAGERLETSWRVEDDSPGAWVVTRDRRQVASGTFAAGGATVSVPVDTRRAGRAAYILVATDAAGQSTRAQANVEVVTAIDRCGTIDRPGAYALGADLGGRGTCLVVEADGVRLDCRGHAVGGVTVRGAEVEVRNCVSTRLPIVFSRTLGGEARGNEAGRIELELARDVAVVDNAVGEVRLVRSSDVLVRGNEGRSVSLASSRGNTIEGNTLRGGRVGLTLESSDENVVTGNLVQGQEAVMGLVSSAHNLLVDNAFEGRAPMPGEDNTWSGSREARRNVLGGPVVGGNYWASYRGVDRDGDGIGETPFGADRAPLTRSRTASAEGFGASIMVTGFGAMALSIEPVVDPTLAAYGVAAPGRVGQIVDLRASTAFVRAEIALSYDPAATGGRDETRLRLYWWDEDLLRWRKVAGSGVDLANHQVVGSVDHFTNFGCFDETEIDHDDACGEPCALDEAGVYDGPTPFDGGPDYKAYGCAIGADHGRWEWIDHDPTTDPDTGDLLAATDQGWFKGCYDGDYNVYVTDPYVVASSVYMYSYKVTSVQQDLSSSAPEWPPVDVGQCVEMHDVCGKLPGLLTEQHCGPEFPEADHDFDEVPNWLDEDHPQYGQLRTEYVDCKDHLGEDDALCLDGRCVLTSQLIDLRVGVVPGEAASGGCVRSFSFEMCNDGLGIASGPFELTVVANGVTIPWVHQGAIPPGGCVLFEAPTLLHILNFGADLDQAVEITVTLDTGADLAETDETNNAKTASVYTGEAYLTDDGVVCNSTCGDSDGGKVPTTAGGLTYIDNGTPGTKNDWCYNNGTSVAEYFCKPIVPLANGLFSDAHGLDYVDCQYLFEPAGKCVQGECVPALMEPTCVDLEGEKDFMVEGSIQTTDFEGNEGGQTDACKTGCIEVCIFGLCDEVCGESPDVLVEWYCDGANEIGQSQNVSCYKQSPPMVCQSGACVLFEGDDQSGCSRPLDPGYDPFVKGYTFETKLQGEEITLPDACVGNKVRQWFCAGADGITPTFEDFNCPAVGALCDDGACVTADPSEKACVEVGDTGIEANVLGGYTSTNAIGVQSSGQDYCTGNGLLVEYHCAGVDLKQTFINCADDGQTCQDGVCQ